MRVAEPVPLYWALHRKGVGGWQRVEGNASDAQTVRREDSERRIEAEEEVGGGAPRAEANPLSVLSARAACPTRCNHACNPAG
eukprot:2120343-Rhodomonas_salina.1